MTHKLTVLALLAAAGTMALPAMAVTADWGVHAPPEVAAAVTPTGVFEGFYLFGLGAESSLMSTTVSNNLGSVLGLADGQVSLFKEAGNADSALGAYAFTATTGSMGRFYSISSSVTPTTSPVPEPNTSAPMLAGFAGMAVLLRRRHHEGR